MKRLGLQLRGALLLAGLAVLPAFALGGSAPEAPAPAKPAAVKPAAAKPALVQPRAAAAAPALVQAAPQVKPVPNGVLPPAATSPKSVLPPAPPLPPPPVAAAPVPAAAPPAAPAVNVATAPRSFLQTRYTGELADDDLKPISGLFKITFQLFPDANAPKEVWSETLYVTIIEGRYDVTLGRVVPIGANLDGRQLFLTTVFNEEPGERIPYAVSSADVRNDSASGPVFRGKSFADVADRALVASRAATADNCSTLGGKTAEEIDQSKELNKRVSELREALREKSSIKLGTQQQVLERVGGAGGNPYQRQCPPGFVVTGFRGGQGQFLDSIEVVCNAIE